MIHRNSVILAALLFLSLATGTIGCGKKGLVRNDLRGTITWKGKPIPLGIVYFTPDSAKGNQGPQGFAYIKDGKYDTSMEKSKGVVPGPHKVLIAAYNGQNINRLHPYGDDYFQGQPSLEIDPPKTGGELNLVIPDATPLAKPGQRIE